MVWWWNGQRCDAIRCSAVRGGAFDFLRLELGVGIGWGDFWTQIGGGWPRVGLGLNWD